MKAFAILAVATLPLLLGACAERDAGQGRAGGGASPGTTASAQPSTALGRSVSKAMDEARAELKAGNIELNHFDVSRRQGGVTITTGDADDDGRPRAELTPGGELLIEGRKVQASPEQHALLRRYRTQVEAVAMAGMDIGVAGADLGMKAAGEALASVFTGNTDQVEKRVEAEAARIEAAALKLCDHLPPLLDTQQKLVAAMPEFRPYADLDQSDIDDCRKDGSTTAHEVRDDVRSGIRQGIREGIRGAAQAVAGDGEDRIDADATDTAAEAEAASASATR